MKQTVVVLRSKTQVLELVDLARGYGLAVKTVPIPKEVKIGCGICVEVSFLDVNKILRIIKSYSLTAFYGVFTLEKYGYKTTFKRIY